MPGLSTSRFELLFRPATFIIMFVLLAVLNTLLAATTPEHEHLVKVRLISVFVYAILGWFTFKRSRICTWVLSALMLLNAISTITISFPALLANQGDTAMQLANLIAGGYFLQGGVMLFLQRPKGSNSRSADQE